MAFKCFNVLKVKRFQSFGFQIANLHTPCIKRGAVAAHSSFSSKKFDSQSLEGLKADLDKEDADAKKEEQAKKKKEKEDKNKESADFSDAPAVRRCRLTDIRLTTSG